MTEPQETVQTRGDDRVDLMTNDVDAPYAPHAELAGRVINHEVPIAVAGGVYQVQRAAEIVAAGQADLVAMTRAHTPKRRASSTNERWPPLRCSSQRSRPSSSSARPSSRHARYR